MRGLHPLQVEVLAIIERGDWEAFDRLRPAYEAAGLRDSITVRGLVADEEVPGFPGEVFCDSIHLTPDGRMMLALYRSGSV